MPNVVRFALSTARTLHVRGAGQFVAGILDVDANDLTLVSRTRYLVRPYGAVEIGIVDSATPPPALPTVPVPPPLDPYPMYLDPSEVFDTESGKLREDKVPERLTEVAQRAASVSAVQAAIADGVIEVGTTDVFRQTSMFRGASIIASRSGGLGAGYSGSNGTDTSLLTRLAHKAVVDLADARLVYANINNGGAGFNDITIRASVELADSTILPVAFDGQAAVTIAPNGFAVSDPLPLPPGTTAGTVVRSRTHVSVTSGGKWPLNTTTISANSEGVVVNAAAGLVSSGTVANSFTFGYGPLCMIGGTVTARPSVAIVGDSIGSGQGDGNYGAGSDYGYIQRALYGANTGYVTLAKPGETAAQFIAPAVFSRRFAPVAGCTHAICQYGINDVNAGTTLATIQANALALWTAIVGRDVTCFQTTITPSSTATNTVPAANDARRTGFNDWLRAGAPIDATTKAAVAVGTSGALVAGQDGHPLSGVFEVADLAETARNSGLWKDGYTADGTHPNSTGHAALAPGVDTSLITV